ncbi:MAG TPA: peptide-methionine (R)-S-oxide reductase MsrB [Candidatus Paceibacterota bacterium]
MNNNQKQKIPKNDDEFKEKLSEDAYSVARLGGTEPPYSGKYVFENEKGMYKCAVCGRELFSSDVKLDSSKGPAGLQGWPSFADAIPGAVKFKEDNSFGMRRTEVSCANCGSHLGHIFDDEHSSTGKHYCINSVCLEFLENQ